MSSREMTELKPERDYSTGLRACESQLQHTTEDPPPDQVLGVLDPQALMQGGRAPLAQEKGVFLWLCSV